MKKYEIQDIKKEVLKSIVCDICKKEYKDEYPNIYEHQEFFHIYHDCGYDSVFGDMSDLEVDICQYCFKEMLESKIGDIKELIKPYYEEKEDNDE